MRRAWCPHVLPHQAQTARARPLSAISLPPAPLSMRLITAAIAACLCTAAAAATLPWVLPGDGIPKDTIRITTLGSGTPDVRRHQVASGFLLELGNGEKLIFDLGSGAYINLLSTGVPHADLTKVIALPDNDAPAMLRVHSFRRLLDDRSARFETSPQHPTHMHIAHDPELETVNRTGSSAHAHSPVNISRCFDAPYTAIYWQAPVEYPQPRQHRSAVCMLCRCF